MACNCATQEQIDQLYKKYGEKKSENSGSFKIKFKTLIQKVGVAICLVLITPFLVVYVFYKAFDDDNRISVKKFFKLKETKIGSNVG